MDDKWESVKGNTGASSKFLLARREMQKEHCREKKKNSRQAAMISGKQICVSCNVFVGFKTRGLNKDRFLAKL